MKLSIITINYNNAAGLEKTMQSVLSQTSQEFEYIVVDGASTDGSIDIIQQFNNSTIQQFNWVSEPDNGIYHAMNKGIRMAKGDYVQFLNSGDWLVDERVVDLMLAKLANNDILVGRKVSVQVNSMAYVDNNIIESLSLHTLYKSTIQHPSAYIRRSLFDKYGFYDESLKIVSDWKWYINVIVLHEVKVSFVDVFVTFFDTSGISCSNFDLDKVERRKVLEELIPKRILVDYDMYSFNLEQINRLKHYPIFYKLFWLMERSLFKFEKLKLRFTRQKHYSTYRNKKNDNSNAAMYAPFGGVYSLP
ncbi:MAG: glycosyltransferase [Candidatus Delongbacteria bacterium]|nr:glycosyltransferase [Candidatus Delongbacteria bacterium]